MVLEFICTVPVLHGVAGISMALLMSFREDASLAVEQNVRNIISNNGDSTLKDGIVGIDPDNGQNWAANGFLPRDPHDRASHGPSNKGADEVALPLFTPGCIVRKSPISEPYSRDTAENSFGNNAAQVKANAPYGGQATAPLLSTT
nr:hypothetical protein Iba_chr08cCG14870 [Ipomoea batatas]